MTTCETCRFFKPHQADARHKQDGLCLRYPPQYLLPWLLAASICSFFYMKKDEWCGEFAPLTDAPST